tara:strand:- start:145 stop:537 length:393 start_codon:yes stop_codon:yes gene_type:complete
MTLGRPPIKDRVSTGYSILFPNAEFIHKIDEIARNHSTSRRQYILSVLEKAIDEYDKEGQTGLKDFTEGAEQTDNLAFMRVTHLLRNQKDVERKTILKMLRDSGFQHPKLMQFTKKAVVYLEEKGVKVWG